MLIRSILVTCRILAPLHSLAFVPPSLVALAAPRIYRHRIAMVKPEDEPSTSWGSRVEDVRKAMRGWTVEMVIEDVLEKVQRPL